MWKKSIWTECLPLSPVGKSLEIRKMKNELQIEQMLQAEGFKCSNICTIEIKPMQWDYCNFNQYLILAPFWNYLYKPFLETKIFLNMQTSIAA